MTVCFPVSLSFSAEPDAAVQIFLDKQQVWDYCIIIIIQAVNRRLTARPICGAVFERKD